MKYLFKVQKIIYCLFFSVIIASCGGSNNNPQPTQNQLCRLVKITTNGSSSIIEYNANGKVSNFYGMAFTYDQNGRVIRRGETTFTYKPNGQLDRVRSVRQGTVYEQIFEYSGGRVSKITSPDGIREFTYDSEGNVLKTLDNDLAAVVVTTFSGYSKKSTFLSIADGFPDFFYYSQPSRYTSYKSVFTFPNGVVSVIEPPPLVFTYNLKNMPIKSVQPITNPVGEHIEEYEYTNCD